MEYYCSIYTSRGMPPSIETLLRERNNAKWRGSLPKNCTQFNMERHNGGSGVLVHSIEAKRPERCSQWCSAMKKKQEILWRHGESTWGEAPATMQTPIAANIKLKPPRTRVAKVETRHFTQCLAATGLDRDDEARQVSTLPIAWGGDAEDMLTSTNISETMRLWS